MLEVLNSLAPFAPAINAIVILICSIIAKYYGVLPLPF
ncbi:hypothetical protein AH0325V1_1983 [Klebsiella pneumoniae]|nr:hypothetical protein SM63_00992 [Klebsiella pneumoniae]CAA1286794.1 Uncharacterised protein [Klebsiella pneumoniae]CAE6010513.1 hypothetical protein AH0325V1_1983 [Klebsiella pneumoniae]CAE6010676.1 hypothetical protein AH0326V1_1986 [Klebsiella pneumoniae]CAE6028762.1 hypothetical protein AH0327V1_2781 [Klebsiella pneumoniae]